MNPKQAPLVLVADDEVNTTIMLQHIFERDGYQVVRVNDGFSAVETAKNILPDLILLDIRMPKLDGFEVLRLLREAEQTTNIPTIVITANATTPADVERGLNLGADDYLEKPFAPQELLARARSKIRARQLEDALHRRTQQLEALLLVSEQLNQHLELGDLLNLIVDLTLDLLPGDTAIIHLLDDDSQIIEQAAKTSRSDTAFVLDQTFVDRCLRAEAPVLWNASSLQLEGFNGGMTVILKHGEQQIGLLSMLSETSAYEDTHLRLFAGIGREATLALRNAQLYQIQADYALHLEDMVAARTQELESAQQLLIRSEKLASIGHLAASIAHEINNPLMPIGLLLERLVDELKDQDIDVDFGDIEMIQEHVERIRRIVRNLLDFARQDPNLRPLEVNHVLEGIIKLNSKFFEHERIEIETDFGETPPVFGSKDQLEAVFMNLTLNAQAAMEGGGKLSIRTSTSGQSVVIEFSDTGHGIPGADIDRIFDPFFSTKPTGTGLGLFVCYSVVEGHHGSIEVESKPGKGTHFTIQLPGYYE